MSLSEDAFVESRSIRDRQLAEMQGDRAETILNKVKALMFAVWQGQGIATIGQVAEFYEVPEDTVQTAIKVNRDEFESDGLRTIRSKALKDVVLLFDTSSRAPRLTVWAPCAALRLGMMLRDSAVERQMRTQLIE